VHGGMGGVGVVGGGGGQWLLVLVVVLWYHDCWAGGALCTFEISEWWCVDGCGCGCSRYMRIGSWSGIGSALCSPWGVERDVLRG